MANLTAPPIVWGSIDEPQAQSVIVPTNQIASPAVIVYTGGILKSPESEQLIRDKAMGVPF